jgi:enoyl-CoA hydratase/carnithine racemase
MSSLLDVATHGRVLRLWLNRPDKRNALNAELCRALTDALEAGNRDPAIHAILLASRGKTFCAGMDLTEMSGGDTEEIAHLHDRLFTVGSRLDKPLVAAVHGGSLGGGSGVVANCHIVVAAEDAEFGLTEIRLGLWPFLIYRAVASAIGDRRTVELALTGRLFGAQEAREFGLVHFIAGDYEERALAIAQAVASSSNAAIRGGFEYRRESEGKGWEAAGQIAQRLRHEVMRGKDFQEALRKFREKKK